MKNYILYHLGGVTLGEWILLALICISVGVAQLQSICLKGRKNAISAYCQIYAIVIVIWGTLFIRTPGSEHQANLIPLWSWYRGFMLNDTGVRNQIYANVALFVPFGFCSYFSKVKTVRCIILRGFLISLFIEMCQYLFCLGLFEWDDMLHNSLGCFLGAICAKMVKIVWELHRLHKPHGRK